MLSSGVQNRFDRVHRKGTRNQCGEDLLSRTEIATRMESSCVKSTCVYQRSNTSSADTKRNLATPDTKPIYTAPPETVHTRCQCSFMLHFDRELLGSSVTHRFLLRKRFDSGSSSLDDPRWSALCRHTSESFVFQLRSSLVAEHYALLPAKIYRFLAFAHQCELIGLSRASNPLPRGSILL